MSLINQMLVDLERRQTATPATDGARILSLGPAETEAVACNRSRWVRAVLWGIALAIGVHLGAEGGLLAPAMVVVSDVVASDVPVAPPETAARVTADAPVEPRYGLKLDGELVVARVDRRAVAPAAGEFEAELSPELLAEAERLNAMMRDNPPAAGRPAPRSAPVHPAVPAHDSDLAPDEELAPMRRVPSEPAAPDRTERTYRQALSSLESGRAAEADQLLRQTLESMPGHVRAREALAARLFNAGRTGDALALLAQAPPEAVSAPGIVALIARIEAEQGEMGRALTTLDRLPVPLTADQSAFRAALLQRLGRHLDAVAAYQSALADRPDRGVWWTGMGISLEALGHDVDARESYRRARYQGGLGQDVARFVRDRLAALES